MADDLVRLLAGGSLSVEWEPKVGAAVEAWLPLTAVKADPGTTAAARIRVRRAPTDGRSEGPVAAVEVPGPDPAEPPLLRLGSVSVRNVPDRPDVFVLTGDAGLHGVIRLAEMQADLHVPSPRAEPDVHFALTVASALLLARTGRALIHAAAVVPPAGRALLLVGDTRAGKSTTTANLARLGWGYLSDDHVVLSWEDGPADGPVVEGWRRRLHLDEGWREGRSTGRRIEVEPGVLPDGATRESAPLGGLLFPEVRPDSPTRITRLSSADALTRLLRQSPWLFADPGSAPAYLERMTRAAARPGFGLTLGLDAYRDPALLETVLEPAVEASREG